jgi:hypothetical protein
MPCRYADAIIFIATPLFSAFRHIDITCHYAIAADFDIISLIRYAIDASFRCHC